MLWTNVILNIMGHKTYSLYESKRLFSLSSMFSIAKEVILLMFIHLKTLYHFPNAHSLQPLCFNRRRCIFMNRLHQEGYFITSKREYQKADQTTPNLNVFTIFIVNYNFYFWLDNIHLNGCYILSKLWGCSFCRIFAVFL